MISSSRNKEMSSGIDEMESELDVGGNAGITGFFATHCEIFVRIAKISQSLRIFAMHIFFL